MKEVSIQPEKVATITPELQPDTFKDNPLYKFCKSCNQYKLLTDFYYNRGIQGYATSCKVCHNEYAHQKQREFYENKYKNNGGSEIIPNKPNTYRDIYQKEQAFWIMELMGWTYNENGIWSKIGIKDLNNNWTNVKVIEKKKRGIGPRKKREYDVDKIKELRDSGFYLSEIAKIMKCSKPTIVKLLKTTYL